MNIEKQKAVIEKQGGLSKTLNMEFLSTEEPDTCMARMKVDDLNRQPFGFLSGGATLALCENLAGVASMALCPGKICVGINVSGNHLRTVLVGDTVTAYGKLQYKGRTLHEWQIDVSCRHERNEHNQLCLLPLAGAEGICKAGTARG